MKCRHKQKVMTLDDDVCCFLVPDTHQTHVDLKYNPLNKQMSELEKLWHYILTHCTELTLTSCALDACVAMKTLHSFVGLILQRSQSNPPFGELFSNAQFMLSSPKLCIVLGPLYEYSNITSVKITNRYQ